MPTLNPTKAPEVAEMKGNEKPKTISTNFTDYETVKKRKESNRAKETEWSKTREIDSVFVKTSGYSLIGRPEQQKKYKTSDPLYKGPDIKGAQAQNFVDSESEEETENEAAEELKLESQIQNEDEFAKFNELLKLKVNQKEKEKSRILKQTFKRLRNKFREDPENFKRQFEQAHKKKLWAASMTTEREEGIENGEIFLSFEEFKKFHQEETLELESGCEHCINLQRYFLRISAPDARATFPMKKKTISKLPILHSQLVTQLQSAETTSFSNSKTNLGF